MMMKANEMVVVTIPTPEMMREMIEEQRALAKQREAERMAEMERQNCKAIVELVEFIKEEMLNCPSFWHQITIYPDNMKAWNDAIYQACPIVEKMFQEAGYKVSFYEYSEGWYKKSGKYGYFSFHFKD